MRTTLLTTMMAIAAAVVACSADARDTAGRASQPASGDTAAPARADTTPAAGSAGESPSGNDWTTGIVDVAATAAGAPAVVSALRTAMHGGFDRFTLEFADGAEVPGYRIEYIDRPLHDCGSGDQIHPVGEAWLEVRLYPAAAHTEAGQPTLPARELPADGSLMLRTYRTCNFEAVVTFVIALSSPNPYRVNVLDQPSRLVIDVRH